MFVQSDGLLSECGFFPNSCRGHYPVFFFSGAALYKTDLAVPYSGYHLPSSVKGAHLCHRMEISSCLQLFASVSVLGRYMGFSVCLVRQALWPCRGNPEKSYHCLDRYRAPPEGTRRRAVYSL
ncbi:hypothetical protein QQF64_011727 [Cirrhinus molitorella]|uniref:Uncharacterized protein n=1 Tax=Cirrhinus molitorella TaxID=172907 RepID=A0ABR3LX14_9TELE